MSDLIKTDETEDIVGAKKGSSSGSWGGGQQYTPIEWPNTLRTNTKVRTVEAISEGEIVGLIAGSKSIYFDNTPLQNADNSYNFSGVNWQFNNGTPDQSYFTGNPTAETPIGVGVQIKQSTGPVIRTVGDQNATSVRIVLSVPALYATSTQGDTVGWTINWRIDVRPAGGTWQTALSPGLNGQKFTSPTSFQYDIPLPAGGYPWDIRVTRTTGDSNGSNFVGESYWTTMVEIISAKLSYPHTAVAQILVDAAAFGQSTVPVRTFKVRGLIIDVPSNYDPTARTYTGVWNGTFKRAYTNNPAWILRDLIVNDRYGLGEFVTADMVDKWALYQIAQYCDQSVSDGHGGNEPRYTLNIQITNKEEAFKLLQTICGAFRGMAFWSMNSVYATADMPQDPVKLYSNANVIDGQFNYAGTSIKARHTVALVTWYDPTDFYRPAVEVVIDDEGLRRFGWREMNIDARGCTTRSMANRYGRWAIDTEKYSSETVEFVAGWDSADIRPGDVVAIADQHKAEVRAGGRLISVVGNKATLDAAFTPDAGQTYKLMVELPDKTVATANIAAYNGAELTLATPYATTPQVGAMWVITGSNLAPRQFRVLAREEKEAHLFHITALYHDANKYARIESGIQFDPIPYFRPPSTIKPPTNMVFSESLYYQSGVQRGRLTISWTPADDFLAVKYRVSAQAPGGYEDLGTVTSNSITVDDPAGGDWEFHVASMSAADVMSQPLIGTTTIRGWDGRSSPFVTNIQIFGRGTEKTFGGQDCKITWTNNFPADTYPNPSSAAVNPYYKNNQVRIYDVATGILLRAETVTDTTYTYTYAKNTSDCAALGKTATRSFRFEVSIQDTYNFESKAQVLAVNNPVPDFIFPNISASITQIFLDYALPSDLDFNGVKVWVQENETYDPLKIAPTYEGSLTSLSFPASTIKTAWVRIAGYDAFGRTDLNISQPFRIDVNGIEIDTRPPTTPTGLALTTSVTTNDDGSLNYAVKATWDPIGAMTPPFRAPAGWVNNLAYYEAFIVEGTTSTAYIAYPTSTTTYEWRNLLPNKIYRVKLRAVSQNGYASVFGTEVTISTTKKTSPPATPTSLAVAASLKSAFLSWKNPADPDIAGIEIWSGATTILAAASKVGSVLGESFTHTGLATGTTYYYWVRALNSSGVYSNYTATPVSVTPGQVQNGDLAANSIYADNIRAGEITGDKLNINTSLPPTITIGTSGVAISALTDPAGRINANTTSIDPGKILISGSTTLASWRSGSDNTKIEGGSIAANTIAANKLTIGSRGLSISGLQFTFDANYNKLMWSPGTITYMLDDGTMTTVSVAGLGTLNTTTASGTTDISAATISGGVQWTSSTLYIVWTKGATSLSVETVLNNLLGDKIILATYGGGINLCANYGRTTIDGSQITTGSITANLIAANAIKSDMIAANAITATKIKAGEITADKLGAGTISATSAIYLGGVRFSMSAPDQNMVVTDANGTVRLRIGKLGNATTDYGIQVYGSDGTLIMSSGAAIDASITLAKIQTAIGTTASGGGLDGTYIKNLVAQSLSSISATLGTVTAGIAKSADDKLIIDLTNKKITISD